MWIHKISEGYDIWTESHQHNDRDKTKDPVGELNEETIDTDKIVGCKKSEMKEIEDDNDLMKRKERNKNNDKKNEED